MSESFGILNTRYLVAGLSSSRFNKLQAYEQLQYSLRSTPSSVEAQKTLEAFHRSLYHDVRSPGSPRRRR